jgi:hypothetical protein
MLIGFYYKKKKISKTYLNCIWNNRKKEKKISFLCSSLKARCPPLRLAHSASHREASASSTLAVARMGRAQLAEAHHAEAARPFFSSLRFLPLTH